MTFHRPLSRWCVRVIYDDERTHARCARYSIHFAQRISLSTKINSQSSYLRAHTRKSARFHRRQIVKNKNAIVERRCEIAVFSLKRNDVHIRATSLNF